MTKTEVADIEVLRNVRNAVEILQRYTTDELEVSAHSFPCSLALVSIIQKTHGMVEDIDSIEQELLSRLDFGLTLLPDTEDDK